MQDWKIFSLGDVCQTNQENFSKNDKWDLLQNFCTISHLF